MPDARDELDVMGHVKWFDDEKGYGFVRIDGGEDAFVHHTEIRMAGRRTLSPGQRVTMEIDHTPKGPQARNVRP